MGKRKGSKASSTAKNAASYEHSDAEIVLRPDVGTQAQFKKQKTPVTYSYDSSLSPQLVWAGKAERQSFDVPTLPLFVHERLSTQAILQTLTGHRRSRETQLSLFADPQHSITDQVLRAYEHRDRWTNRLILGDSLVVMNSLVHYESLGGQVQMIYLDPPYGVKFGSNFQPFVRRRDVKHGDDEDLTREPEMVQAYRDTWELGLHSYLTYLRDRLLVARELLSSSGSIFVQISDENLHHVREIMDEVFGAENFVSVIAYAKTTTTTGRLLPSTSDYILWYARDAERVKYRQVYVEKTVGAAGASKYDQVELPDGDRRVLTAEERANLGSLPAGSKVFTLDNLTSPRIREARTGYYPIEIGGRSYLPQQGEWKTHADGIARLINARRIEPMGNSLRYVRFFDDFPVYALTNLWTDIGGIQSRSDPKIYAVQTSTTAIQRCMMMTTDPGDLILDPTCGSGTTAYVAEQWGRRWITIDVSRVPLALARQRLLTATFPWYELADEPRGPAGGFAYRRKQNKKGEEVGGIVPHVTLKSIANNEPPAEEVLVDRPETTSGVTRVTGPFCFEASIPTAADMESPVSASFNREPEACAAGAPIANEAAHASGSRLNDRMLEVLRKSPVLRLEGNKTVTLKNVRLPAKTLSLSAEAIVANGVEKPVAFVFGPEHGAVSERLVFEAAREAHAKSYSHLYVIGFAIQPNARGLIEKSTEVVGVPATYVQATPDLLMGDLLKNMRSSQIFSVCGLPEIEVKTLKPKGKNSKDPIQFQVQLLGLDVFDPVTMEVDHRHGHDVPAWLLDTDYNDLCFHVCQAFFPRTAAWDNLKRALKGTYDESVWDHLAGSTSAPFDAGEHGQIAVKVIDDRGNELLVVKKLEETR